MLAESTCIDTKFYQELIINPWFYVLQLMHDAVIDRCIVKLYCINVDDCSPSVISNPYLLVADYNGIRRMNLNGTDRHTVISNLYNIHGLDFDILTNMLYWCDVDLGTIHRASIGGDGNELIISGLSRPEEVAVDWINRKLYWCDYGNNTIEYSDLDGSGRTVLVNTGLDQPRGMAIDPSSGHIYWSQDGLGCCTEDRKDETGWYRKRSHCQF